MYELSNVALTSVEFELKPSPIVVAQAPAAGDPIAVTVNCVAPVVVPGVTAALAPDGAHAAWDPVRDHRRATTSRGAPPHQVARRVHWPPPIDNGNSLGNNALLDENYFA